MHAIYANTWEGLTVKMLCYNHDHCSHFYAGTCEDLPLQYKKYKKNNVKYVFIFKEEISTIYMKKQFNTS